MSNLTAGWELDLNIAKAIGISKVVAPNRSHEKTIFITSREWDEIRGIDHPTCEGGIACIPFQPSTDLNAAFAAAEKVGLFDEWTIGKDGVTSSWCVFGCYLAYGPTAALAICAAILALKESQEHLREKNHQSE